MQTKTVPLEAITDDYCFPNILVSLDVSSVQNRAGVHIEAGMLVSADVCAGEDANGALNMLVLTLTYAENENALKENHLKEIEFAFPKTQAVPVARKILSGATKGEGLMLLLEWVYCESPDDVPAQQFKKIKFLATADNASPLATMLISSVQDPFDARKPVIGVTPFRV